MPRARKSEKFSLTVLSKSGLGKNFYLLKINFNYEHYGEEADDFTLQDLLDFLEEKGVEPSRVTGLKSLHFSVRR